MYPPRHHDDEGGRRVLPCLATETTGRFFVMRSLSVGENT